MSITKKYIINGPSNIVRLTNNDKILYIMGDISNNIYEQTECQYNDDYEGFDIDKFILLFMKKNKIKTYDLFVNIYNKSFKSNHTNFYKETYIDAMLKLFQYYLIKDKTDVKINPKYPNFRFHYSNNINTIVNYEYFTNFYNDNISNIPFSNLNITNILEIFKEKIVETKNSLLENSSINKILNKYSNNQIKIKINDIYIKYIDNQFNILFDLIDNLIKNNKQLSQNIVLNKINTINLLSKYILLTISNLFFIRRFLDKNYIKNTILYTNMSNFIDIIYILVKFFNFKITHLYNYSNINKINEYILNYNINNTSYIIDINNKFELINESNIQCSNLFDFPDDFN